MGFSAVPTRELLVPVPVPQVPASMPRHSTSSVHYSASMSAEAVPTRDAPGAAAFPRLSLVLPWWTSSSRYASSRCRDACASVQRCIEGTAGVSSVLSVVLWAW